MEAEHLPSRGRLRAVRLPRRRERAEVQASHRRPLMSNCPRCGALLKILRTRPERLIVTCSSRDCFVQGRIEQDDDGDFTGHVSWTVSAPVYVEYHYAEAAEKTY